MPEFPEKTEEPAPKSERLELAGELAPQAEEQSTTEPDPTEEPVLESEEKRKIELAQPSKELAIKLVSMVDLKHRISGVYMNTEAGDIECPMFNLEEVADFLEAYEEKLLEKDGVTTFINPNFLKKWVEETLGDKELAEAIGDKIDEGNNYAERILPIRELLKNRLRQCGEITRGEASA